MRNNTFSRIISQYQIVAVDEYNEVPRRVYITQSKSHTTELTKVILIDLDRQQVFDPQMIGSYAKFMCPIRYVNPKRDNIAEMQIKIEKLPNLVKINLLRIIEEKQEIRDEGYGAYYSLDEYLFGNLNKKFHEKGSLDARHFYFKYTEGNKGFIKLIKSASYDNRNIPLPIFFGKWRADDYANSEDSEDTDIRWKKNHIRKAQVDLFFGIREQEIDCYFWIFLPDEIYAIKLQKPYDVLDFTENIPDFLFSIEGSIPKYYNGFLEKRFNKKDLPESFSNTNTNQKFNRKTIVEFEGKEKIMANHLIFNSGGITISEKERLLHLSPVQFETLIFLIFVQNNIYCSTYRGGTKEKYDLLIDNKKEVFRDFEDGIINIQIKMKKTFYPSKSDHKTVYIYLGKTNKKINLFGIDWILERIKDLKDKDLQYIDAWLKGSLKFFNIIN